MKSGVIHMPRLDTVIMVEDALRGLDYYPTKNQLWRALPRMVMWQTLGVILDYLKKSNKILIDRGRLVWIFADSPEARELVRKSVKYDG